MNTEVQAAFWEALEKNDVETVRLLIAQGADVNLPRERTGYDGHICMQFPIFCINDDDDIEMLHALVEGGVDVNQRDEQGSTPLLECDQYCSRLVQELVKAGAQVNCRDDEGNTPLMFAALLNATESVRVLLAAGAHVNVLSGEDKESPYDIADFEDMLEPCEATQQVLGLLTDAGALPHLAIDIEDAPDISPRHYEYLQAVQYQDIPRIVAALAAGADVNATDRYGASALKQAVEYNNAEICRLLVEYGISAEHLAAALQWAWRPISKGNADLVLYLLSQLSGGALLRAQEHVLLTAIRFSDAEMVRLMLDRGTNPNCIGAYQLSALMAVNDTMHDDVEVAQLLLDAGADVNYVDDSGWNAVLLATARRQIGVMRLLLRHGADYLHRNENGASAYSRSREDAEVAKAFDETLAEMGQSPLT